MTRRRIQLMRESFTERPAFDAAIGAALLHETQASALGETLRIYRPGASVAFGRRDALCRGYPAAVRAAHDHGFAAVQRLAGGRAGVFHQGTLGLAWTRPDLQARRHVHRRFEELAAVLLAALRGLGIDARVGEVPGEYCPGAHSIHGRGQHKLVGAAQRVVANAAHLAAVIVVTGAARIREVLVPVYDALELAWSPRSVGSLERERGGLAIREAEEAIRKAFAERYELVERPMSREVLALAGRLEGRHGASPRPRRAPSEYAGSDHPRDPAGSRAP